MTNTPSCCFNKMPHAPRSFYEALFVRTPLGIALRNLKMDKAVLGRLKPQECKQGSGRVKLPIPYIPKKHELQEAVETAALIKLTLPTKVELRVSVWSCSTLEKFIMHVQQPVAALKAMGLRDNYKKLVWAKKKPPGKI